MTGVSAISQQIWDMKYRLKDAAGNAVDKTSDDTWLRVAQALAEAEAPEDRAAWANRFHQILSGFEFLPAGRIIAGAGSGRKVTLFNCFVMGAIPDDMSGIFEHLKEAALTMQPGGGIGYFFSTLRPMGAPVRGVGADASGPLSFMDVWDAMCRTIMSAGSRRGAMMGTLRCDHPDIEAFIEAKHEPGRLRMFNLSVLVSDGFIDAVKNDAPWELTFAGTSYRTVQARDLWDKIMRATFTYAEPGVIFIDRINRTNNLYYEEEICATNPCGEQPLPPYGACLLGSVNLATLVRDPFCEDAALDLDRLREIVPVAVRMLDNAIDVSRFPLEAQELEARRKRRMGLGITGLADALIMCRVRYGSPEAVTLAEGWLKEIERAAYLASAALAAEKGPCDAYDKDAYLAGENIQRLDRDIREAIAENGIRNALLTSIAPTGTISLFADNVSSGLEPVFAFTYTRHVMQPDGTRRDEEVSDYAYRLYRRTFGERAELPSYFTDAQRLTPNDHVVMQAAAQKYVDSSISKTINVPADISFEDFKEVYLNAYDSGCKGCTTYRPNEITGAVLEAPGTGTDTEIRDEDMGDAHQEELPLDAPAPRAEDQFEAGGVVYMTRPLDRPGELPGKTYKLKWPESDHAIYITINDVIQDGRQRPFEIFINSKNMDHYAWTVALTRMISAVFRRGGDVSFVVEELKAVFDPRGGQWMEGRYVPSLLAAIGNVIENHLIDIGFIKAPESIAAKARKVAAEGAGTTIGAGTRADIGAGREGPMAGLPQCPKCGSAGMVYQEGCDLCLSCGYSKCA
ncbi:MAG: adenosylcobalamin-dependent ribonucleoside-diphosphate reductase [Alphaproteobacteria bacterium]|nr:adenosylcobalamin-dependent ribonucleoside-diphosphate reductase [Alphaproteobacteria bacterium]